VGTAVLMGTLFPSYTFESASETFRGLDHRSSENLRRMIDLRREFDRAPIAVICPGLKAKPSRSAHWFHDSLRRRYYTFKSPHLFVHVEYQV
jgi:hypothetical protein